MITSTGSQDLLTDSQSQGLRDYFLSRALLAQCNCALLHALRALETLADIPNLRLENGLISLSSNKQQIVFELLDNFGNPFKGAKEVSVALVSLTETGGLTREITKSTKLNKENNVGTISRMRFRR